MDWSALPPATLTQLDLVKKLLADKELSDNETSAKNLVDSLFKQSKVDEMVVSQNCIKEVLIIDDCDEKLEVIQQDDVMVNEPPAKLAKFSSETSEKCNSGVSGHMFADILENGGNLEETIQKMSQFPVPTLKTTLESATSHVSEKGLMHLAEFISNNLVDCHQLLISHCLAPAIVKVEAMPRGLMEKVEYILQRHPDAMYLVVTAALIINRHVDFCLDVLQPITKVSQLKRIIIGWVPKVQMDQSNLYILERVLNLDPRVLEDSEVTAALLVGLSKEAESQSSSPKYAKFLLFLIKNLPNAITKENYNRIEGIVGKNKTFLRKAMENNLKKRSISG